MFVNSLESFKDKKLSQILHTLKHVHQWEFGSHSRHSLAETQSHYEALKQQIIEQSAFNSYYSNPEYTKAALITEAIKMLLEIAPKRRKKSVKEGTEQNGNKDHHMRKGNLKEKMATRDWDGDGKIESEKDEVWGSRMRAAEKAKKKKKLKEDQNLEQAETLLAAKDISDQLQDMAEDAAKMSVDALMPLVDTMKAQFGQEQANAFNEVVKTNLQSVLDAVIKAKDETDNAIMALQGGQTPSATTDISQPLPAEPGEPEDAEPAGQQGAEIDLDQEFAATPAASGPKEEPLGRASKRDLAEGSKKCMECGTGMYETQRGKMTCNECGSTWVAEAWGTKMKTAKKDIGKWDGYSISELKARKKKLMSKEGRSAAEQKEVRQINFAIRAKQENHWGKIKEAAPSTLTTLATMAATGKSNGKMLTPQQKKAAEEAAQKLADAKIEEKLTKKMSAGEIISDFVKSDDPKFKGKSKAERTKMAMHPEESKTSESQLQQVSNILEALQKKRKELQEHFQRHEKDFAQKLHEGLETDPLNLGYGLEGDVIRLQIQTLQQKIQEAQTLQTKIAKGIRDKKQSVLEAQSKLQKLDTELGSTPYGVIGIQTNGKKIHRLFESQEKRQMWLEFQQDSLQDYQLIDPQNIDKAKQYLKKRMTR